MSESSTFAFDRIDRRTRQVTPALVEAILDRIVSALNPLQIILFGSQAWGDAEKSSDIDLLICLDDEHPMADLTKRERAGKVLNLFRYRSFGLDVIVLTHREVQDLQDVNEGEWDLVLEILKQGKVLYERQDIVSSQ
jgi:uncharacterized protein